MGEFHQHPGGLIYVRADHATYADSLENFIADFGVEPPALPVGADHVYTQGKRHALMGNGNVIPGSTPMPWPEGDQIIANIDVGLAAKAIRDAAEAEAARATKTATRNKTLDAFLDLENRVRTLEGREPTTLEAFKQQYEQP